MIDLGQREAILGRIREALRVPAPRPHDGRDDLLLADKCNDRGLGSRRYRR